ncbi:MAG: peptide chain release factor N(5)-glutamine methyltransferase, partial [Pirellulales bacterium]|nr:peptide chain release factor N(5)-glutamine methyltransferase [Pirellulales bacterium]
DSRVDLVESNWFEQLDADMKFDIVCSNPPYVSEAEYAALAPTVRDYEPRVALVAGPAGTECIEFLLQQAPARMHPGGRLIIELSPMIADACAELASQSTQLRDLKWIKDLEGRRRILSLARR